MLTVWDDYLQFDFECTRYMPSKIIEETNYHKTRTVTIQFGKTDKAVFINAWLNIDGVNTLIFEQLVPFIVKQRYTIKYFFGYTNTPLRYRNFDIKKSNTWVLLKPNSTDSYIYQCKMKLNPKAALKEFKHLKKAKLISTRWSTFDGAYITYCEACNYVENDGTKSSYVDDIGRVIEVEDTNVKDKNANKLFYYNGKLYYKKPEWEWHKKTFYNKDEWKEKIVGLDYKSSVYRDWKNLSEYESPDTFDEDWKYCGGYWRDSNKNVVQYSKPPVIGAYEKVVSKQYLNHKLSLDFNFIFSNKLEVDQIYEYSRIYNEPGGAWRSLKNPEELISDIQFKDLLKHKKVYKKDYEEVVSPGWHNKPLPGSVECPVCRRTYELSSSVNWRNYIQNLRTELFWKKEALKRKHK